MNKPKTLPSLAHLKKILQYDSDTGIFVWKINRGRALKGKTAGTVARHGYIMIGIDDIQYFAHRLAFAICGNKVPDVIDHKNRNTSDNRLSNLRPSSPSHNQRNRKISKNNTSGITGVAKCQDKWQVIVHHNKKQTRLGEFACKALAGITLMRYKENKYGGKS